MVVHWDPFRQFRPIQAEAVDQLRGPNLSAAAGLLAYDVYLHGDELLIEFDVPGVSASNIEVTLEDRTLVVRAHRASPRAPGVDVIDTGRQHGSFCQKLWLGDRWDPTSLQATTHDGVLTVRASVRTTVPSLRVPITPSKPMPELAVGSDEKDLAVSALKQNIRVEGDTEVPVAKVQTAR